MDKNTANGINNYYSTLSDEELKNAYNYILKEKNRVDWAYYYICLEIENRKKQNAVLVPKESHPSKGGFNGESQFQKRTDEIVQKELKKDNTTS